MPNWQSSHQLYDTHANPHRICRFTWPLCSMNKRSFCLASQQAYCICFCLMCGTDDRYANRPLKALFPKPSQKKPWVNLLPYHQDHLYQYWDWDSIQGWQDPPAKLAQRLSASPALWRCSGMHRMLVMLVSFVRQIENGTHIYSPLNHKNITVCRRGKKKSRQLWL